MMIVASKYRGEYISQTIEVERQVNYILAMLFAGSVEQQQMFERVVLERSRGIGFSLKIDLMLDGLKARCPEIYKQFAANGLFRQVNAVREHRNRLAHAGIDTSAEYIRESIGKSPRIIGGFRLVIWTKGEQKYETISISQTQENHFQVVRVIQGLAHVLTAVHGARKAYDEGMLRALGPE
jgi:hypothetical protein